MYARSACVIVPDTSSRRVTAAASVPLAVTAVSRLSPLAAVPLIFTVSVPSFGVTVSASCVCASCTAAACGICAVSASTVVS